MQTKQPEGQGEQLEVMVNSWRRMGATSQLVPVMMMMMMMISDDERLWWRRNVQTSRKSSSSQSATDFLLLSFWLRGPTERREGLLMRGFRWCFSHSRQLTLVILEENTDEIWSPECRRCCFLSAPALLFKELDCDVSLKGQVSRKRSGLSHGCLRE